MKKLHEVITPTINTAQAAEYLNRSPQTLRSWASTQSGLIQPIHIGNRLAWRVSDIRKLLGEV